MTQADSPMRWRERASPTPLARQTVSLWRFVARWDGGVLGVGSMMITDRIRQNESVMFECCSA
jgi:hypothetical protein